MTRGRYWDGDTGSIKDIQAIAWEIFSTNYPYTDCAGEIIPPTPPDILQCFGGGTDEDECNMAGCITNLTWEDGQLYMWFGPCCKILVEGDAGSIVQPPPPDTATDPADPTTWACNKASGMATTFFDVIVEVVAAISPFSTVYEMFAPCYQIIKRYGAVWGNAQQICTAYIADKSAIDTMVADLNTPGNFTCTWSPILLPTDNLNSDEFWSIQTSFPVKFSVAQNAFLVPMTVAIGLANFAWWARLFHDDPAVCVCPDENEPTEPTINGWYLGRYNEVTVVATGDYSTYLCNKLVAGHDAYGCLVEAYWTESPPAGLVPIAGSSAGCSGYDVDGWGDTSQALETEPQGTQFAGMVTAVAVEVFGAGNFEDLICTYETNVVASPNVDAGETVNHGFSGRDMTTGKSYTIRVRLLHNTGSPSHS